MTDEPGDEGRPRRLEYLSLDDLLGRRNPRNPKDHANDQLSKSLGRFGYTEPVLIDERTGMLSAGHGRVENLDDRRRQGQSPPEGIMLGADGSWLVPAHRGWASRSDEEAAAYLVASNQLTIAGGWHADPLADLLQEIQQTADGFDGTAFTDVDLEAVLREVEAGELMRADLDDVTDEFLSGYGVGPDELAEIVGFTAFALVRIRVANEADHRALFETLGLDYKPDAKIIDWPRPFRSPMPRVSFGSDGRALVDGAPA